MKLTLAVAVYLVMGLILGLGILMLMKGSYWLLIVAALTYLLLFARFGCTGH